MKTIFEHIRNRLLKGVDNAVVLCIAELKKTEWSPKFEQLMRNRLILGAFRYGKLNAAGKVEYDRVSSIAKRLELYQQSGNKEHLVDIANLCLCEFEECGHPNAHFKAIDDGEHTEIIF